MRAYLHVTAAAATLHLPSTPNRTADAIDRGNAHRDLAPGWHRATATWEGFWFVRAGRRIDPEHEARRLNKLADIESGEARTRMPGVAGYQHMANMSTAAADTQYLINRHFATLLAQAARSASGARSTR